MHMLILCRSLTYAQRAERLLRAEGIFASVAKAPQSASPSGCTYGVKVAVRNLEAALARLHAAGLKTGKILEIDALGDFREVAE